MASSLEDKLNLILQEKQEKIIPENIKEGVQIFDIMGTLKSGGSSSGVKLFETEEEMQADTTAQKDDLAVVYGSILQNVIEGDKNISSIYFPETVTLSTPVLTSYSYSHMSGFLNTLSISLNNTDFTLSFGSLSDRTTIEYTSVDGTMYTRTTEVTNPVTLSISLDASDSYGWDDILGYFIQIPKMTFNGLYQYNGTQYELATINIIARKYL